MILRFKDPQNNYIDFERGPQYKLEIENIAIVGLPPVILFADGSLF